MGTRITALPTGSPDSASYLPFDNGSSTQKILVNNLQVKKTEISLPAASWTSSQSPYVQIVSISGVSANSKVDIQCDSTVINQLLSDGTTALYTVNNNGTIYVYAVGEKPTANITLQATISEVIV